MRDREAGLLLLQNAYNHILVSRLLQQRPFNQFPPEAQVRCVFCHTDGYNSCEEENQTFGEPILSLVMDSGRFEDDSLQQQETLFELSFLPQNVVQDVKKLTF